MTINNEYPAIDGVAPSWADIQIRLTPEGGSLIKVVDIAAINTGTTIEIGKQRGASGGRVLKRTTGSADYEASLTLYRSGYQKLLRALGATASTRGNQVIVGLQKFLIQVQHSPPGAEEEEIFQYNLKGCRLMGRSMNGAEGTDPDQVETPLDVIEIVDIIDGKEHVFL